MCPPPISLRLRVPEGRSSQVKSTPLPTRPRRPLTTSEVVSERLPMLVHGTSSARRRVSSSLLPSSHSLHRKEYRDRDPRRE